MQFREIKNDHKVNSFLDKQNFSQFLQSSYWRDILEAQGQKASIASILDNKENIILTCLLVRYDYKYFSYYYAPRGPILTDKYKKDSKRAVKLIDYFFSNFKKSITDNKVMFLRLEPNLDITDINNNPDYNLSNFKIKRSLDIQPSKTRVLDLNKSEAELLAEMHRKTRYNVRLSKKKGVEIIGANDKFNINTFIKLLQTTSERNKFSLHQEKHYRNLYKNGKDKIKILFAKHENDIIAGAMFSFFGDTVTYLHGASANKKRNLMAPHLLQWQTILKARNKGFKYYDFGGIDAKKWPGVTRFKAGFGGREYMFVGTFDLMFQPLNYYIYTLARKIRRKFL